MNVFGKNDPPADERFIVRPMALAAESTSNPENALQNLNTGKLANGAMAMVYNVDGSQDALNGFRVLYVFDKAYTGPPSSSSDLFTPIAGGGVWRRFSYPGLSQVSQIGGNGPDVTITAGAGNIAALGPIPISPPGPSGRAFTLEVLLDGTLKIAAGAVPPTSVVVDLQRSFDNVVYTTLAGSELVLLANQQTVVALSGSVQVDSTQTVYVRLAARAIGQNATASPSSSYLRLASFTEVAGPG